MHKKSSLSKVMALGFEPLEHRLALAGSPLPLGASLSVASLWGVEPQHLSSVRAAILAAAAAQSAGRPPVQAALVLVPPVVDLALTAGATTESPLALPVESALLTVQEPSVLGGSPHLQLTSGAPVARATNQLFDGQPWNAPTSRRGVMVAPQAFGNAEKNKELIDSLLLHGVNIIRYQINWQVAGVGKEGFKTRKEFRDFVARDLDTLDTALPALKAAGIKVVLDLHRGPGAFTKGDFYEGKDRETLRLAWRDIANRYAGKDLIFAYDLMNEPDKVDEAVDRWNQLATELVNVVRAVDPATTIIVESVLGQPEYVTKLKVFPKRLNVVYSFHFYEPGDYTHQGIENKKGVVREPQPYPNMERILDKKLLPIVKWQADNGVHIIVGEFSVANHVPSALTWLQKVTERFELYGWDHIYHAWREAPVWSLEAPGYEAALNYMTSVWNGTAFSPAADQAFDGYSPTDAIVAPLQPAVVPVVAAPPKVDDRLTQAIAEQDAAELAVVATNAHAEAERASFALAERDQKRKESRWEASKVDVQEQRTKVDVLEARLRETQQAHDTAPNRLKAELKAKVDRLKERVRDETAAFEAAKVVRRDWHEAVDAAIVTVADAKSALIKAEKAASNAADDLAKAKEIVRRLRNAA